MGRTQVALGALVSLVFIDFRKGFERFQRLYNKFLAFARVPNLLVHALARTCEADLWPASIIHSIVCGGAAGTRRPES
jgi:hypothetical protein